MCRRPEQRPSGCSGSTSVRKELGRLVAHSVLPCQARRFGCEHPELTTLLVQSRFSIWDVWHTWTTWVGLADVRSKAFACTSQWQFLKDTLTDNDYLLPQLELEPFQWTLLCLEIFPQLRSRVLQGGVRAVFCARAGMVKLCMLRLGIRMPQYH